MAEIKKKQWTSLNIQNRKNKENIHLTVKKNIIIVSSGGDYTIL